jgi:hypothetical protein
MSSKKILSLAAAFALTISSKWGDAQAIFSINKSM